MNMKITSEQPSQVIHIKTEKTFDFTQQHPFRDAYKRNPDNVAVFHVDLSATEYIDSAALGMLMMLKRFADTNQCEVVLSRPTESIKKILNMAHFDELFSIEY